MLVPISIKGMLDIDSDNYKLDMLAAVYNTIDLGRDKIFPGAFIKSLQDKGNTRSILWQHQIGEPVGKGFFTDTTKGLACQALLPKSDTLVSGRVIPQLISGVSRVLQSDTTQSRLTLMIFINAGTSKPLTSLKHHL